ncbi:3-hydroxyisobutyryl-CoA hydrolase, partial [Coemansia guatemalensis]
LLLVETRLASHDMQEGIEALLVRKTNDAKWEPPTLKEVDMQALSAEYFDNPPKATIAFNHNDIFTEYPHKFRLPTESDIRRVVCGKNPQAGIFRISREDVIRFFEKAYEDKIGVRQKVAWVLDSKTKTDKDNFVQWIK